MLLIYRDTLPTQKYSTLLIPSGSPLLLDSFHVICFHLLLYNRCQLRLNKFELTAVELCLQ